MMLIGSGKYLNAAAVDVCGRAVIQSGSWPDIM